jgi:hypothetical protein
MMVQLETFSMIQIELTVDNIAIMDQDSYKLISLAFAIPNISIA